MTDEHPIISPKKLIEVALPLDAINAASAREKSIRHGHPSTLHLWFARRPLAAARAVIFSQLVNDPEDLWRAQNPNKEPNKQVRGHWTKARARLFRIIEDLVLWESTTNEEVLENARAEIRKSWLEICELNEGHPQATELFSRNKMPGLHDPFAGGGAIPLEAQRLELDSYASDLNPVAVLINKAMIEIPPKFAGLPPANPESRAKEQLVERSWRRCEGMAEDVRYYGKWLQDEAEKRLGELYPKIKITDSIIKDRPDLEPYGSRELSVIAWLWARTVKSPNPAFRHVDVPLISSFVLSKKKTSPTFIEPIVEGDKYRFEIRFGTPSSDQATGTAMGRRKGFRCLLSGSPIDYEHIRKQAKEEGLGVVLMAIAAKGDQGRVYLSPTSDHEEIASNIPVRWKPDCLMPQKHRNFQPPVYGMDNFGDIYTDRQLELITTLSELIADARETVEEHAASSHKLPDDHRGLSENGVGARAYAEAVSVYLAFILDKLAESHSTLCTWSSAAKNELVVSTFRRQALPMTWDFAEANPFANSSGSILKTSSAVARVVDVSLPAKTNGQAEQANAAVQSLTRGKFVSTDPPYYDNISYADLSDYFYVLLRRVLKGQFPLLFSTLSSPKSEELISAPNRHAGKDEAEEFFLHGMTDAMRQLSTLAHVAYPITIYYAFKQSDTSQAGGTSSTGWETFLEAVIRSGFSISGTWPIRTEREGRSIEIGSNALASSIVLVCKRRLETEETTSRREFIRELNAALPVALDAMTRETEGLPSPVAPVDLSQAIIGPGMAIFSKYSAVLEADGSPMTVRTALQLINRFLAEDDFDADTQFCLHWFETHGWEPGVFGEADVLARAKATSVSGLDDAGVIRIGGGKVQLLRWNEYPVSWDPNKDLRLPIWETLHQLIRAFRQGGESAAGDLLAQPSVQSRAEAARQLAYRLYTLCERKNWAEDARAYNELITSWSAIETAAPSITQRELF